MTRSQGWLWSNSNEASIEAINLLEKANIYFKVVETTKDILKDESGTKSVPVLVSTRGDFEGVSEVKRFIQTMAETV